MPNQWARCNAADASLEAAGSAVHFKNGDVVSRLIAAKQELAGKVEVEEARIIPSPPFFPKN